MKDREQLSRRDFVRKLSVFGFVGLGAGSILKACGNGEEAETDPDDPCNDLSDLTDDEIQTREAFEYVAETPNPDERCDNCQFWLPDEHGEECGGCDLFAGPVHPAGWCNSWVEENV